MSDDRNNNAPGSAVPFFLAVLVLVGIVYGGIKLWQVRQYAAARGQAIPAGVVGPPLTDFELTERSGKPFRSADMRGRLWVASYFFTTCPGNCITVNRNIQALHNSPELKDVTWVSITCDPDTDTLEALRKYADGLRADPERWLFCRADLDYTKRVALGMHLFLSLKGHQDHAIVIDKAGKIQGAFDAMSNNDCSRMRTKLIELLKEEPPHDLVAAGAAEKKSN
jgi:cytochrome oxidase Cu insertion factor (SCO1/SenC/PrrC family)